MAATERERDLIRWGAVAWYLGAAIGLSWTLGTEWHTWAGWALFLFASVGPVSWTMAQIRRDAADRADLLDAAPRPWSTGAQGMGSQRPAGAGVVPRPSFKADPALRDPDNIL